MQDLFNETLTIKRKQTTHNGQGGYTHTLSNVSTTVLGRLSRLPGSEKRIAAKLEGRQGYMLYVPAGTDIQHEDVVTVNSLTVRIISLSNPSQIDHHLECLCVETQVGK